MFVFRLLGKELAMSISFLIICLFVISTSSFPANDFLKDTGTESHGVITLEAIYITTATFLDRMQLVNDTRKSPGLKVFEYFGTDQESKQQFTKIIHEISGYESIVQRDKADKSFFHVYGEQIQIGHFLIKNIRSKIQDLSRNKTIVKANISFIRELVATILYIIQEFYRNTNWIDLHGNTIYKDFGKNDNTLTSILIDRKDYCFLSNLRDCYPLVIKSATI